ncbi:MAG: choice-of-anchor V domain-containing protein, partial [Bacteroidota bacterium]
MIWIRVCVGVLIVGLGALVPGLALSRSSGAPAGFAGDIIPSGEPRNCTVCHSGNTLNDPLSGGSVTINAPGTAVPGETITITVVLVNNTPETTAGRRQGFLTTVKNPADSLFVGSFTVPDPSLVQLTDGNDGYVTHTSAGNAQTTWSFQWTAPTTDVPSEVVIYTAGNAANGVGLG